ncbi:MAG: hypothetical protein OEY43_09155 [Gammaproteobacteria bacterium]|nr:hypothetical protein [Gammaproteobacteria bacterium]
MNKRILEALPLRQFFQEQLDYLGNLLSDHQARKSQIENRNKEITNAVETLVEGTDGRLRAIGNYKKQLRDCTRELLDYIDELVASMPAALTITKDSFIHEPLVNMLFINCETMRTLFCYNPEVRHFFSDPDNKDMDYLYALLFLNHKEKNILGAEINNEIVLRDVQQTHISFDGHQLLAVCATEEEARQAMRETLFTSVVKCLRGHITQLRHALSEDEKIQALNHPDRNINNPEVYIKMLVEQLSLPRELIKLQDNLLKINSMGIKLPLDSNLSADVLKFYEVEIGDHLRVATIVRYPRCELPPKASITRQP